MDKDEETALTTNGPEMHDNEDDIDAVIDVSNTNSETDFMLLSDFREKYKKQNEPDTRKVLDKVRYKCKERLHCKPKACVEFLKRLFPFFEIMRNYNWKTDLISDLIPGLTVGILQLPQGMAYSMLAEMPPIVGLYLAFFPVVIYFFFASSRHNSMGTIVSTSVLVGAAVSKFYDDEEFAQYASWGDQNSVNKTKIEEVIKGYNDTPVPNHIKIGIATTICLLAGFIQVAMGVLRLGFVTTYLSEPLIEGFIMAISFQGITSQVKYMLGLRIPRTSGIFRIMKTYRHVFAHITETNFAALIIAVISVLSIYLVKYQVNRRFKRVLKMPIPIDLIVAIIGTACSTAFNFNERFDIDVVGDLPAGMPSPTVPSFKGVDRYIPDIFLVAIVAFTQSISLAALMANKHNYKLDSNQELLAYGTSNIFGSFFMCYPMAASVARTTLIDATGAKTQVASIFSSGLVLIVILWIGPLFEQLPKCCLSAVIVVALWGQCLKILDLPKLWKVSRYDVAIWLVTAGGTIFLQFDYGLLLGLFFSVICVTLRSQLAKPTELGKVEELDIYTDSRLYEKVNINEKVKVIGFSHPIFFANGDTFSKSVLKLVQRCMHEDHHVDNTSNGAGHLSHKYQNSKLHVPDTGIDAMEQTMEILIDHGKEREVVKFRVVLDFTCVSFVDSVGCKIIRQVIAELELMGVAVYCTNFCDDIWRSLDATGFIASHKDKIFLTIDDAMKAIRSE